MYVSCIHKSIMQTFPFWISRHVHLVIHRCKSDVVSGFLSSPVSHPLTYSRFLLSPFFFTIRKLFATFVSFPPPLRLYPPCPTSVSLIPFRSSYQFLTLSSLLTPAFLLPIHPSLFYFHPELWIILPSLRSSLITLRPVTWSSSSQSLPVGPRVFLLFFRTGSSGTAPHLDRKVKAIKHTKAEIL